MRCRYKNECREYYSRVRMARRNDSLSVSLSADSGRRDRASSLTSKHPDGAGIIIESYLKADFLIENRRIEVGRVFISEVRVRKTLCARGAED